jgi:hypothetical protein
MRKAEIVVSRVIGTVALRFRTDPFNKMEVDVPTEERPTIRHRSWFSLVILKYNYFIYIALALVLIILVCSKVLKSFVAFTIFIVCFFVVTVIRVLMKNDRRRRRRMEQNNLMISNIIRLRDDLIQLQQIRFMEVTQNYLNLLAIEERQGASHTFIATLPHYTKEEPILCCICMEDSLEDMECTRLPCTHEFHSE